MIDTRVRGGQDLARLARQVSRQGGPQMRRRMAREMRAEARPMVPAVRSAIMAIPVSGPKHTGLRSRLAKAVTLNVRTSGTLAGVGIRVDARKMPDGEKALPALMEGAAMAGAGRTRDVRWRHPVYGGTTWVQQSAKPYFYATVDPLGLRARRGIDQVLTRITREIT